MPFLLALYETYYRLMDIALMPLQALDPTLAKMQQHVQAWEATSDRRAIFLTCYAMMTQNMLVALAAGEFQNRDWAEALLRRFADYYFEALVAYEGRSAATPPVWQHTFESASRPDLHVIQHLFMGVNAHINYDLVFVLEELLRPEWPQLDTAAVESYYRDHCYVNEVIFRTINAVQDEVVERYSPLMDVVDKALGNLDEHLLGQVIRRWREEVWSSAIELLNHSAESYTQVKTSVCERGQRRSEAITGQLGLLGLRHLL